MPQSDCSVRPKQHGFKNIQASSSSCCCCSCCCCCCCVIDGRLSMRIMRIGVSFRRANRAQPVQHSPCTCSPAVDKMPIGGRWRTRENNRSATDWVCCSLKRIPRILHQLRPQVTHSGQGCCQGASISFFTMGRLMSVVPTMRLRRD